MLEMYYKYRLEYKDFLIFIKVGSFYEVFDKDSLILNEVLGYKVKRIKDSISLGFPISKIDYVIRFINNVNYVIVDKDLVKKKEFINNRYNEFNYDINNVLRNFIRIGRINEYLNNNFLNDILIDNIEHIIYGKNIN